MAKFTGVNMEKNKHGSIVHAKMEVHEKDCQLAGLREVGDAAMVTACPCIKGRLLTLLMATLAVRGAADPDEPPDAGNADAEFTIRQMLIMFLAGIAVGMYAMAYCCAAQAQAQAEPVAENVNVSEGEIIENEGEVIENDGDRREEEALLEYCDIENDGTGDEIKEAVMEYDVTVHATTAHFCERRKERGARDRRRACKLCVASCP
eukprot:14757447-Heterocapsa_arctica.AAC.1